jgi:hypothetical protein
MAICKVMRVVIRVALQVYLFCIYCGNLCFNLFGNLCGMGWSASVPVRQNRLKCALTPALYQKILKISYSNPYIRTLFDPILHP